MAGLGDAQIAGKISLGVSVRVLLEEISIWFSRLSKFEIHFLQHWQALASIGQATECQSRIKREGKANYLFLLELECHSFPTLRYWLLWFLGLQTLELRAVLPAPCPDPPSSSEALGLRLNYTTSFSVSPACRLQTVALLSFRNQMRVTSFMDVITDIETLSNLSAITSKFQILSWV